MKKQASLILVCGLPGAGKSTVAKQIAEETKALMFNTDAVRKKLFEEPAYTQKEKDMVYKLLFEMADKFLKMSRNVVLDGTFYREDLRKGARKIAEKNKSRFMIVEVVCSEKTTRSRLGERAKTRCASDADFRVYRKIRERFEPIRQKHFIVDSGKDVRKQIAGFLKEYN